LLEGSYKYIEVQTVDNMCRILEPEAMDRNMKEKQVSGSQGLRTCVAFGSFASTF